MIRTNYTPRPRVLPHVAAHATLRLRGHDCTLADVAARWLLWWGRGGWPLASEADTVALFCADWPGAVVQ